MYFSSLYEKLHRVSFPESNRKLIPFQIIKIIAMCFYFTAYTFYLTLNCYFFEKCHFSIKENQRSSLSSSQIHMLMST